MFCEKALNSSEEEKTSLHKVSYVAIVLLFFPTILFYDRGHLWIYAFEKLMLGNYSSVISALYDYDFLTQK